MDQLAVDVVERVVHRWRTHAHYEDLRQVALVAAWQHEGEDAGIVGRRAKEAVIDELRRFYGRPGTTRYRLSRTVSTDGLGDDYFLAEDPGLATSVQLGLGKREGFIVDALGRGWPKQDIAKWLGVHPSRVSQLLVELRETLRS